MRRVLALLLVGLPFFATAAPAVGTARLEGSNLPPPNHWKGDRKDFEPVFWQHGIWRHALHNRRLGWWWDVRMDHFAFEDPIFPYPDMFTPAGYPVGWWYWCDQAEEYYPYVTNCPGPWENVKPGLLS